MSIESNIDASYSKSFYCFPTLSGIWCAFYKIDIGCWKVFGISIRFYIDRKNLWSVEDDDNYSSGAFSI